MTIYKNKGIIYSECFLQLLSNRVDIDNLTISVEVLDNCREQGYSMRVRNDKEEGLTFYVYAHRISGEPTITWENEAHYQNMFTEEAWLNRTETKENITDIVEIAEKLIEEKFGDER